MLLVKSSFNAVRCNDLDLIPESLWTEFVTRKICPQLLGVIYQLPSADICVLEQLYCMMISLATSSVIVVAERDSKPSDPQVRESTDSMGLFEGQ